MWWGSGQDPDGSGGEGPSKEPPQNQQLIDLQEQFESQQTLIAQLKEMLKKSDQTTTMSREKVEEYASTLNKMNERAKRSKLKKAESTKVEDDTNPKTETVKEGTGKKSTTVTPAKERVNLLRQQLEENRLKLAQRDKNQKGIEEMVNQLKAQLDDSQIMISQTTINLPKVESKPVIPSTYNTEIAKEELISILQNKDKQLEELNNKLHQLQGNVLDLQENVKEKDSVIDARTKAITLLSENLSKKGKNTLDMLDETKEQMRNMQEQFVTLESKMKEDNDKLQKDLENKNKHIEDLVLNNNSLKDENKSWIASYNALQEKLELTNTELSNCKLELSTSELKIQDLTKTNHELENSITELKIKTDLESSLEKSERSASSSPQRGGKQKSKNWKKSKQKNVSETQSEGEHLARIAELEKRIEELKIEQEKQLSKAKETEENAEVENLKKQLETMNKNMIKTKAQYKGKLKELQKKSTPGDINERILNLEAENVKLEQRIAELEEEKGNLQLRLVDIDNNKDKERIADLENKIEEQKMEIENHIRIITILETQITDKSTEISSLRSKLGNLMHIENAQVCSEITSVQLEEQLDKEVYQKKELEDKFDAMQKENKSLVEKIEDLHKEKQEMNTKLVNYMQENMELIDRLEKSSAEKVSSAESIEIVESLTQQEKLEIEAYQKSLEFIPDKENIESSDLDPNIDLNESVSKLTEDSSELLERIELFTVERREVMEKMDSLLSEKEHLLGKIGRLENEKTQLLHKFDTLCKEKEQLVQQVESCSNKNEKFDVTDGIRMDSSSNAAIIEEYQTLIDHQKVEISELKQEILRISENNNQFVETRDNLAQISKEKEGLEIIISSLNEQFLILHKEYDAFLKEHKSLKDKLKKNSEMVSEKEDIGKDYNAMKQQLVDFEKKVSENVEEITALQSIIEDNKLELINSADYITSLTNDLSVKHSELTTYQNEIDNLNTEVQQLNNEIEHKNTSCENHIETIDLLSAQLQELKTIMNENFEELQKYEELNDRIGEAEKILEFKDSEIIQLRKEKSNYDIRINNLVEELKRKDDHFKEACQQLKDKCVMLESKIQANSGSLDEMKGPFEAKINLLEAECKKLELKSKEQVEKMKKFAANLKKKVANCNELEGKLVETTEKWEKESKEKGNIIKEQETRLNENENKIKTLLEQLREMEIEVNNIQIKFDNKNTEYGQLKMDYDTHLQKFEEERAKLEYDLSEYITFNNNLQANRLNYENEIEKLNAQIGILKIESETNKNDSAVQNLLQQIEDLQLTFNKTCNAMEAKIQEKDLYIENIDAENSTLKEKLARLHEGLSQIEERRQSLEQRALELGAELEAKVSACEEVSLSENLLENRLAALITHDEAIENKLKEFTISNQSLNDKNDKLTEKNLSLQAKLSETELRLTDKIKECEKLSSLESDSLQLREVINSLEHEIKKLHVDYDRKLFEKANEVENMDQELNNQIEELNRQRIAAINHSELLEEKIQELNDNEQAMNEEINNLNIKLSEIKIDLDKQLEENGKLHEINKNNLLTMDQLQSQLSQIQPIETDINSMQLEINKLQKIVAEKDNDIQNYQRQNMQLQMCMTNTPSLFDFPSDSAPETKTVQDNAALLKQHHDLTNELKVSEEKIVELEKSNAILLTRINEQKQVVEALQAELGLQKDLLVRKTAEHHIDEIICTASQTVLESKADRLEYIEEAPIEKVVVKEVSASVSQDLKKEIEQELLKKIKTLEFMLYNVEKEKDEAITQCHSLSNELTRLIYEREGLIDDKTRKRGDENREVDLGVLEGDIISMADLMDSNQTKKDLNVLEYTKTKPIKTVSFDMHLSSEMETIQEEIIVPKSTYLCYSNDKKEDNVPEEAFGWGIEDDILRESLESQIIKESNIPISSAEQQELKLFEFEPVRMPKTRDSRPKPIEENIADPKLAYLCFPDDSASIDVRDAFAGEEDGWGWNAEEVKLEAKHQQSLSAAVPIKKPEQQLTDRIRELETERNKLLDDIKAHQIKAVKFVKKLKDMKAKNDKLMAQQKSVPEFDILDMAIQDELHVQIKTLETKLKETMDEKTKERAEKENLLKRIDVLTGANERMVEIKEKQDTELQMLHFNNRQLSTKLEQMEWGVDSPQKIPKEENKTMLTQELSTDGYKKENEELNTKLLELNSIINDLTIDNEEMQLMLEEQRKLRIEAEKALANLPIQENMKTEQEYLQLKNAKDDINNQLMDLLTEKQCMSEKIIEYSKASFDLCPRLDIVQDKIKTLAEQKNTLTQQYSLSLEELQTENKRLREDFNSIVDNSAQSKDLLESEVQRLKEKFVLLEKNNSALELSLVENQRVIIELNSLIEKLNIDKNNLEVKLREISGVICSENADQIEGLGEKLEVIVKEINNKNKEVSELNDILNLERAEFEQKLSTTLEQLAIEWATRVDQRGNDVAESWKLHVESRENEFLQLEQSLRMEISEAIKKNESLATENNELQKKVELLLQEKQAAASDNEIEALQQIISERQSEIISFSQQLQDVGVQLDVKNNEMIALQQIIDSIQKTNHELIEKNNDLRANSVQYEQSNVELESEVQSLKKLSKENEDLAAKLQLENQEINILKQSVEVLQQELLKVQEELSKEQLKSADSVNRVIYLEQNIQNQEAKLQELINGIQEDESMTSDPSFDRVLYLQEWINQINQKQHELFQQKEQFSYEKSILEETNNQLNISLTNFQQMNDKLMTELSDLRETTRTLEIDLNDSTQSRNIELGEMNSMIRETKIKYEKQLSSKDDEIKGLNACNTKQRSELVNLETQLQSKVAAIVDLEAKNRDLNALTIEESAIMSELRELIEQQTSEIKRLKDELEKKEQDNNVVNLETQLQSKIAAIVDLEAKNRELNALTIEESAIMSELRELIEQQTSEIKRLKDELEKKELDYNVALDDLENMTQLHQKHFTTPVHEKHVHFKEPLTETKSQSYQEQTQSSAIRKISTDSEDVDVEPVNRAELDLALYMLHQRDVRCEELTVELIQLLEERDTLQLRLSNAIRINEELRNKGGSPKEARDSEEMITPRVVQPTGAIPKSKSSDIILKATGTELAAEATEQIGPEKSTSEEKQDLDTKLLQLRSVGYRDKTIIDDQENRFLQQMSIMQQHRDLASRLPPEAAARLVDASYTLSRDVQSPSKVLLNWLWGKSTPKVNDI